MSLLDMEDLIEIKVYYKFKQVDSGKKLIILNDNKAKKILKTQEKNDIEVLTTKWKLLSWEEQNDVMGSANKNSDLTTGIRTFDPTIYRDRIVKNCLKEWDLTYKNNSVPVTSENINKLPADIVTNLYLKFDNISTYTEEEVKN